MEVAKIYRSELKFVVEEATLQIMQNKLNPLLELDQNQEGKAYRIRSMYFDTYERKSYRENDAGVEERKKYRIRVYDRPKDYIRLEIKHKLKDRNYKESCQLSLEKYNEIMDRTLRFNPADPRPLRMLYLDMQMNLLRPSIIVEYERTAYVYHTGNIRITFDRNIAHSSHFEQFLEDDIPKIPLLPSNKHVFEVKYNDVLPGFIAQTIETGQLERTTFSKFFYSHLDKEGAGFGW